MVLLQILSINKVDLPKNFGKKVINLASIIETRLLYLNQSLYY